MLRLNLSTYTSRSIWHAFSPGSLLASHLFHVFKGDKLAWGSKERSKGDHDFWQWDPRGCCERQTGSVFEIFSFSFDAFTFRNFEHLSFPSLSFPSFLTYWIVSKKVSFYTNKTSTKNSSLREQLERLWCNGTWSWFHLPWRAGRVGLWNDKPRSDDRCEINRRCQR